jgi:hypothetical protein
VIDIPLSLPNQTVTAQAQNPIASAKVLFKNFRLERSEGAPLVIKIQRDEQEKSDELRPVDNSTPVKSADQGDQNQTKADPGAAAAQTAKPPAQEQRSFWARVFNLPPLRKRIEKALTEDWKFTEVRPRHIEWLLTEDGEEARTFFLDGLYARQYQRLLKEYGCGFQDRNGRIVDDSFDTINEYGPELIANYQILMQNRELIKRYFAGVFRDGRIGTQSLIRISNSMWFGPFEAPKFRQAANILNTRFQVPNHVIGPMLASVGDSFWLRQVLYRKTSPAEFHQLLNRIATPSTEGSGNAFAPALQLMVLGEEHKIPFRTLDGFVEALKLEPKDFGPFSATVYNIGPYRLAHEIKCPTFAQYLRRVLDEFGPSLNQESARLFLFSFREFKENGEALQSFLSPQYQDTRAYLKSIGIPIPSTVWNMERIAVLNQTLTPEKRAKISQIVRQLSEEVKVADVMFLSDISDNEEEVKLLLNRSALLSAVKDIKIDRIVERSNNDLVKELEREIDAANRNGLYRTVRRLSNLMREEKKAYTERVDPAKLSNIQLSRLLIFHRSLDMPGFLDTLGWNVSLDLQNDRSEGGGYLGYDKDMAMVTIVAGQPGNNKQYRPQNIFRAPASLALFHNHAFKDTFAERYLGFLRELLPSNKNKNSFAGPSGWVGAKKGDISAAAESELPSFIITKIGYPENSDGSKDRKNMLVNLDWVVVDPSSGEALRSDRGTFTVPFYGDDELGKLKWPSKKEMRRQERERREKCPPIMAQSAEIRTQ